MANSTEFEKSLSILLKGFFSFFIVNGGICFLNAKARFMLFTDKGTKKATMLLMKLYGHAFAWTESMQLIPTLITQDIATTS